MHMTCWNKLNIDPASDHKQWLLALGSANNRIHERTMVIPPVLRWVGGGKNHEKCKCPPPYIRRVCVDKLWKVLQLLGNIYKFVLINANKKHHWNADDSSLNFIISIFLVAMRSKRRNFDSAHPSPRGDGCAAHPSPRGDGCAESKFRLFDWIIRKKLKSHNNISELPEPMTQ